MNSGMCIQTPSSHQQMHTAQEGLYVKTGQEQSLAAASMEPKIEIVHLTVCDVIFIKHLLRHGLKNSSYGVNKPLEPRF